MFFSSFSHRCFYNRYFYRTETLSDATTADVVCSFETVTAWALYRSPQACQYCLPCNAV